MIILLQEKAGANWFDLPKLYVRFTIKNVKDQLCIQERTGVFRAIEEHEGLASFEVQTFEVRGIEHTVFVATILL